MRRFALVVVVLIAASGMLLIVALAPRPRPPDDPAATLRVTTISGGVLQDPNIVLERGDRLLLRVTADRAMRLQLEGYEIAQTLQPGQPTDLLIDAWAPGVFALRDMETGTKLGILVVRDRRGR